MPPRASALSHMYLFITALALMIAPLARGDVTASLPLRGYFRAGRFMPVRLQVHDVSTTITLSANGAVPTDYRASGNSDVIVPWLPLLGSGGVPRISGAGDLDFTPHALSDDESLVALAGEDAQNARLLFPGKKVIVIPLDLSRPLMEPALAWEGVDGVVLSSAAAKQLSPEQIEVLASASVVLAIRDVAPPDRRWPWRQEGDFWVLRHTLVGPRDAIEAAGYSPTYSWQRGWPAPFRRQLLLAALVFMLLALAVTLWRSRITAIVFVGFCAASAGLLAWWYGRQSPMLNLAAGVMVTDAPLSQVDVWHWQSPLRPSDGKFPVNGLTYPILPDVKHAATTGLRLVCRADGSPSAFQFHLEPQQSLAFVTRLLRTDVAGPTLSPAAEPFQSFANDLYVGRGETIRGQFHATDPQSGQPLPVVLITRGG